MSIATTAIASEGDHAAAVVASGAAPLACHALDKRFGQQQVLRQVSLQVAPGSVLGLIGRNGAGKTTLIRALLGLLQPDAGESFVFGQPALALDDHAKQRLGYVPQQPEAMAWMQVGQMLDFIGSHYPRWDDAYVADCLQRWQLPRDKALGKLSPGERQRVAIIRALAPQPQLLVLDEPAAALDPVARRELLREIASRAGESGTTVLFSTHIVSDLERVASHIAFLHQGRLLLHDELDALKERHLRLHVPAALAATLASKLPGEVSRRRLGNGALSIILIGDGDAPWPALARDEAVDTSHLALEDLFVEVVDADAAE